MRRSCLMLLILPAGLNPVVAGDNPFSKTTQKPATVARSVADPSTDSNGPALSIPVPPPIRTTVVRSAGLTTTPKSNSGAQASSVRTLLTQVPHVASTSMADLLLAQAPSQLNAAQNGVQESPSDMPERELPNNELGSTPPQAVKEVDKPTASDPLKALADELEAEQSLGDPRDRNPLFGPSIYGPGRLATVEGERMMIPPLIAPTTETADIGSKVQPDDIGGNALVSSKPLPEGFDRYGDWSLTSYFWQAPNTFSHPLYFDDPMLERHGHERFPCLTPMISGARFFGTIPMLPYLATVKEPCDCVYTLGHFRPGTCAPALIKRPPYERRAAIVQALATAGFFVSIP